jgi:hypothetical protein
MDPPWFPFIPKERGIYGYGGFVYLRFAIEMVTVVLCYNIDEL